ncbi:carbonic anhydrase 7-like [Onthophagus taurus]|uniref:carbonic anhydrase 7-like n=1 Tax=Onthophagus taurus TaxID=166361 RepID=UPI000C2049D6|nr:carbonic anhydrase 7-like [Onthophagus taurus]
MARTSTSLIYRIISLILLIFLYETIGEENLYHSSGGTASWVNTYKECGGKRQSPISLPSAAKAKAQEKFPKFERNNMYDSIPDFYKLTKNYHTIQMEPRFGSGDRPNFTGGPLHNTYILEQLHFHWAAEDEDGCEHSVDGRKASMEAHAVHFNSKYNNIGDALSKSDGLVVVAYFYNASDDVKNSAMDALTNSFAYIYGGKTNVTKKTKRFPISKLIPEIHHGYLTYPGSLTTPPCSESVTWIVYETPIPISHKNIGRFREFYKINPYLKNNFRPLQELNDRVIIGRP